MEQAKATSRDARLNPVGPPDRSERAELRIGLVCPYSLSRPGGVQGQVVGLTRALETRGHRVTVFAPLDDPADAPAGIDMVVSGRSVALPANGSRAPVSVSPRSIAHAVRAVQLGRFDVLHVHEPFSPGLPYGLLVARRIPPMIATFHRSGGSFFYSVLRPVARLLARKLATRCAVSEAARETAFAALDGEYEVLFNGVEIERYRDADPWPKERPAILFLGRHEERKGLGVLLEAFAMLAEASERAPETAPMLWIAGNGPETDWLHRLHPDSPDIRWLGVLTEEEKRSRLVAADLLCAPSLGGESFGMVLLEAMAARTLVVASDIDGYRDAVGGHAALVPPGDPRALASALAESLAAVGAGSCGQGSPSLHDTIEAAARRADGWSMSRLAEQYERLYVKAAVRSSG
jgi:phosphatidyl-myo-inositol alpha-mannosyltransferase